MRKDKKMFTWLQTRSGKKFDFSKPEASQICIEDIAWGLSGMPRFAAQSDVLYTVAEHSLSISLALPRIVALEGLLHDAAEAYTGDIPAPLKQFMGEEFFRIEAAINAAVAEKFSLSSEFSHVIKLYDSHALYSEARVVFYNDPIENWHEEFKQASVSIDLIPDGHRHSIYNKFLLQFNRLRRN